MTRYSNAVDPEPARYAARQPILTANQKVIGYKLLFRTGIKSYFTSDDSSEANRTIISVSSLLGLTTLCDNRLAFVGCPREILLGKYLTLLPPEKVVAEISNADSLDVEVQLAWRQLKDSGYKIALSDFVLDDPRESLATFADFVKVDIKKTPAKDASAIVKRIRGQRTRMLAENVDTREEFEFTREAGFRYFQGYFFRKPEKMRAQCVSSSQVTCIQLLQSVSRPEMDWQEVEEIIKRDATLYYRLLRYLNSAAFGFRDEVHSVRHALITLGEDPFRRWCRLAAIFEMSQNRPSDLMLSALVRARFGELIGEKVKHDGIDLFLLGLLSLMDAILEAPMGMVLDGLPLDPDIKTLLLEHKGRLSPLFHLFHLLIAVDAGAWKTVVGLCKRIDIPEEFVAVSYRSAMEWAQTIADNS